MYYSRPTDMLEEHMTDEPVGFRKDCSTVQQQILTLWLIDEKARRKWRKIVNCFADFHKA